MKVSSEVQNSVSPGVELSLDLGLPPLEGTSLTCSKLELYVNLNLMVNRIPDNLDQTVSRTADELETDCPWPEWGQPLPPEDTNVCNSEDIDEGTAVYDGYTPVHEDEVLRSNSADKDQEASNEAKDRKRSNKTVSFSEVVTFSDATNLHEERKTWEFSDDELARGTDQISTSSGELVAEVVSNLPPSSTRTDVHNPADMSAACQLLNLSNKESDRGDSVDGVCKQVEVCRRALGDVYDPTDDLERLSGLVEKLYAVLPQLSNLTGRDRKDSWTIEVTENPGKLKIKRIKGNWKTKCRKLRVKDSDIDEDNEGLDRPPRKRQYRSMLTL